MLKSNKSLLQRARIAMVAIVTIMSIGGAYAMNAPKVQGAVTYAVIQTNASSYQVTTNLAGSCDSQTAKHCEIRSSAPVVGGNITKTGAVTVLTGQFTPSM